MVSEEKSAKSVEKEGERYRVSLQSTTVYTEGGQLLPKGAMRKNSGVITNFPITHIFTLRRLLMLLPRRIMMAEEKGACYTILVTIPALWLDPINAQDLDTLSLAMSCTFAKGAFPMNVPPFKMVGSATYLPVSIVEAKAAGSPKSQAVPRDHLPSTPVPTLAFSSSDSLAPRETQEHSGSHSFHLGNNSRPDRVGGKGQMGRIKWEEKKIVVLILLFLKVAHQPTPQKIEVPGFWTRFQAQQLMFPECGWLGVGSCVRFPRGERAESRRAAG